MADGHHVRNQCHQGEERQGNAAAPEEKISVHRAFAAAHEGPEHQHRYEQRDQSRPDIHEDAEHMDRSGRWTRGIERRLGPGAACEQQGWR